MKAVLLLWMFLLVACQNIDQANPPGGVGGPPSASSPWLIPTNQVFEATGRDGIPALNDPELIEVTEAGYMFDPELILGYFDGTTAIAFPHHILDWHEIINIRIAGFPMAVTYCPLTGTGIGWPQKFDDFETEFAVSGLLYNNNLIAFDRNTGSNWSQMNLLAVNGPKLGTEVSTLQLLETRWSTWISMYPNTKVVGRDTGWDRPYGTYPYGDFKSDHDDLFYPLTTDDMRLPRKERVHGIIINGAVKVYRFESFGTSTTLINDSFQGEDIIVIGNQASNFLISFFKTFPDGNQRELQVIDEGNKVVTDNQGNKWDVFGRLIEGPLQMDLQPTQSFMGYWFAWGAFYPTPEIYGF